MSRFWQHYADHRLAAATGLNTEAMESSVMVAPRLARKEVFSLQGVWRYLAKKRLATADALYYHNAFPVAHV